MPCTVDAMHVLARALDDEDPRVALRALRAFEPEEVDHEVDDLFERIERLAGRLPTRKQKLDTALWAWRSQEARRQDALRVLVRRSEDRPIEDLLAHIQDMGADDRLYVAHQAAGTDNPYSWATQHLKKHCRRGALLFLLTSTRPEIPSEPARLVIAGNEWLHYAPRSRDTMDNPNHTPLAFEKMI